MRCLLVAVVSVVASVSVHAQPNPDPPASAATPETQETVAQAKTYYEAGHQAFINARYVVAIAAFSQALSLAPSRMSVRLALAESLRYQYFVDDDGAKAARALSLFREYVAAVSEGKDREVAVRYIAELTPVVAHYQADRAAANQLLTPPKPKTQLMVTSRTPNALGSVDGNERSPMPVLIETTAGHHRVHLEADGYFDENTDGIAVDGQLVVVERQLREKPATIQVTAPENASIDVDGKEVGSAPIVPITVAAGRHTVTVRARGHVPFSREVQLARAEVVKIDADPPITGQRKASYVVVGGAAVLLAAGGIESLLALSARSDANALTEKRLTTNLTHDEFVYQNQRVDDFHTDTTASYFFYGGAAALCATSVLLYLFDQAPIEMRDQPSTIVVPNVSVGGFTLSFQENF